MQQKDELVLPEAVLFFTARGFVSFWLLTSEVNFTVLLQEIYT